MKNTILFLLVLTFASSASLLRLYAAAPDGAKLFAAKCASCHGANGEGGTDGYEEALVGDSTVEQLTKVISETMPEGEPEACVGDEAKAIARFIHESFYSEAARSRRPPRVRLARLTALQLRRSLEDIRMRMEGWAPSPKGHGLKGVYYTTARMRRDKKKFERVDPTVAFDFGKEGPGQGIKPEDFSIEWSGLVRPRETGKHEFVVTSSCAFVMYLGASDREFINNHVQSGDKTEFRKSVTLTAGRMYPIRIRFYQRKRKTEQPPAKITLAWKRPHRDVETIPTSCLSPSDAPATFALQTKLPPDDQSYGYPRGIAVNRQWDDSTTVAALEFSQAAIDEMWPRFRRGKGKSIPEEDRKRLRAFLTEIIETAFREPLTDDARKRYVDAQLAATSDDAEAIKRSVLLTLKSPRFLYPTLDEHRSDSQRAANRLALTLFDSLPSDDWLVRAGREGRLEKEGQIRGAAQRMLNDYRVQGKVREFLYGWLNIDDAIEIAKDPEHFAEFDSQVVNELRDSFDAFVDHVVWSEASDYRQLFLSDWTYTSNKLQAFYGEGWEPAAKDATGITQSVGHSRRRGLLTHPYMLSRLAYADSTSPIHRGVFLLRHVLGRTLRPPQEAFTPLSPDLHPDLTTRQRVALQTSPKTCQVCHVKINALGFTLESFDAVGRYRNKENGREIDVHGSYTTSGGETVEFDDSTGLAEFLARSHEAQEAFVERAFQHFVKQPPAAFGKETLNQLTAEFKKNNCNIKKLLVNIAVVAAREPRFAKSKVTTADNATTKK